MIIARSERLLSLCQTWRQRLVAKLHIALCFRPSLSEFWNISADKVQEVYSDCLPLSGRKLVCFAHYDPQGIIDSSVVSYVKALAAEGFTLVFISTAQGLKKDAVQDILPYSARILLRQNFGLDFASWDAALKRYPDIYQAESLLLVNDSAWLTGSLAPVFAQMSDVPCDFWGMLESHERRPHLQSNFLYFRKSALSHPAFHRFWKSFRPVREKNLVIRRYESTLTLRLALAGLRAGAFVPAHWLPDKGRKNPSLSHALELLPLLGVPLLKRQLLRDNPVGVDLFQWEATVQEPLYVEGIRSHAARLGISLPKTSHSGLSRVEQADIPVIEVLLPTYNGERFLPHLLQSLEEQRGVRIRLTARDDGSCDKTISLLHDFARRHPDTRVLEGEHLGVVANVGTLMQLAEQPYFMLADQDDVWYPHKCLTLWREIRRMEDKYGLNRPLLVYSDSRLVDAKGLEISASFRRSMRLPQEWGDRLKDALVISPASGCTMLGNKALRDISLPFPDENEIFMHDWWLLLLALATGFVSHFDRPFIDYRQHDCNVLGAGKKGVLNKIRGFVLGNATRRTQWQAKTLLSRADSIMTARDREVCEAWANMQNISYVSRLIISARYGFYKPGLRMFSFLYKL